MTHLIVTGSYRSGTTLLQKLLDSHPSTTIMNHGMIGYFQIMKPFLLECAKVDDKETPLGFNWIEPSDEVMSLFQNTTFDDEMVGDLVRRVESEINIDQTRGGIDSHPTLEWLSLLKQSLSPGSAKQILLQQLLAIPRYKQSPNATMFGFKELHLEQFVSPMLRDIPDLKVIQIIRDPRAILASRNFTQSFVTNPQSVTKHPIRLISSVWKTAVQYSRWLANEHPDSFLSIRYETLVRSPESVTREICDFLGIDWNPAMLDVSSFRSESGGTWVPNTSFDKLSGFDVSATEKWRSVLPEQEHAVMEYLCGKLLEQEGYTPTFDRDQQERLFLEYREDQETFPPWARQPLLQIHQ